MELRGPKDVFKRLCIKCRAPTSHNLWSFTISNMKRAKPLIQLIAKKTFLIFLWCQVYVAHIMYVYRHSCFFYIFVDKHRDNFNRADNEMLPLYILYWLSRIRPISGNWLRIWLAMWSSYVVWPTLDPTGLSRRPCNVNFLFQFGTSDRRDKLNSQ